MLLTVGRSYVGNDVTYLTLLDRAGACSYENLPKYRSYRVSNTAPWAGVDLFHAIPIPLQFLANPFDSIPIPIPIPFFQFQLFFFQFLFVNSNSFCSKSFNSNSNSGIGAELNRSIPIPKGVDPSPDDNTLIS